MSTNLDVTGSGMNVVILPALYHKVQLPGGKEGIEFSADGRKLILESVGDVGSTLLSFEQKRERNLQVALTLQAAFTEYKALTNGLGLPAFVNDCLDSTCPRQYGKVGTPDRDKIVKHSIFRGVEAMMKAASRALKTQKENQALLAAGIDPKDGVNVNKHNKEIRDEKQEALESAFGKALVDFDRHGVTATTIESFIIRVLGKKEKDSDELTAGGKKLRDAAIKALFVSRGGKVSADGTVPPQTTPEVPPTPPVPPAPVVPTPPALDMAKLEEAIKNGDNAAIHAAVSGPKVAPVEPVTPAPVEPKVAPKATSKAKGKKRKAGRK